MLCTEPYPQPQVLLFIQVRNLCLLNIFSSLWCNFSVSVKVSNLLLFSVPALYSIFFSTCFRIQSFYDQFFYLYCWPFVYILKNFNACPKVYNTHLWWITTSCVVQSFVFLNHSIFHISFCAVVHFSFAYSVSTFSFAFHMLKGHCYYFCFRPVVGKLFL